MYGGSGEISRRAFIAKAGAIGVYAALGLPACGGGYDHAPLIALWRRRHALEKPRLKGLRFTLSPNQISSGKMLKVVLRDQLGGDWLFKMGDQAIDGAEAVYRLGCLLDWETPEPQRAELPVNDSRVTGSVQRFVPNAGVLAESAPGSRPSDFGPRSRSSASCTRRHATAAPRRPLEYLGPLTHLHELFPVSDGSHA